MNITIRLMLVSLLTILAAPAFSAEAFSTFLKCEQDDDASNQDLLDVASKWLAAAKKQKGGANIKVSLHFPVVAQMGETDFSFVISAPSLAEWGMFMDAYDDSPASKFDKEWDELAACPDSALIRSVAVK